MDFDSPEAETCLFSESGSKNKKEENDFSDHESHEKVSKKELLFGRKKDKKDKKVYAVMDDSDEDISPSKSSKKSKAFKFPSKSKEKREKSRDKEKEKEVEVKKKDKNEKIKGTKDKKDKKLKQGSVSEEVFELGDVQPVFGVSLGLSLERSRCHDHIHIPLVVRDCVDYLQDNLASDQMYVEDTSKTLKPKLQVLKKLYNNRESTGTAEFDVPTACVLLKMYLRELPEPILTTDLTSAFEEAAAQPQHTNELKQLIGQLPSVNYTLLAWLILHLDDVTKQEKFNKMNAQNLAMLLAPDCLQMSHRLFVALLLNCDSLFSDIELIKYIPPITATSPNLPETVDEITKELKKQESLLAQIHAEMNAGFVTKKREEQLWEVQRIITQLKRKLRSFEKKMDSIQKSLDDTVDGDISIDLSFQRSDDTLTAESTTTNTETKTTPQDPTSEHTLEAHNNPDQLVTATTEKPQPDTVTLTEDGIFILPDTHPDYLQLMRMQLEQQELNNWKLLLQKRINVERAEMCRLKQIWTAIEATNNNNEPPGDYPSVTADMDSLIAHYHRENAMLDQKKRILANDLFEEQVQLIQLQVDYALQNLRIK